MKKNVSWFVENVQNAIATGNIRVYFAGPSCIIFFQNVPTKFVLSYEAELPLHLILSLPPVMGDRNNWNDSDKIPPSSAHFLKLIAQQILFLLNKIFRQ